MMRVLFGFAFVVLAASMAWADKPAPCPEKSACAETACAKAACSEKACAEKVCPEQRAGAEKECGVACAKTASATACCKQACSQEASATASVKLPCTAGCETACAVAIAPKPSCEASTCAKAEDDKVDHLIKAAEHLQAAGQTAAAQNCRELASKLVVEQLAAKRAELAALKQQVQQLQAQSAISGEQVLLKVKVVEYSRTNMKQKGLDFAHNAHPVGNGVAGFVEAMVKENLARVVAEPTIVTTVGRPASYCVGGEIPVPKLKSDNSTAVEYKPFGTQLDAVVTKLADGKVRVNVRPRISHLEWTSCTEIAGQKLPLIRVHEVDTSCEMELGQTAVFSSTPERRIESEQRSGKTVSRINDLEIVFLVTPELITAQPAAAETAQPPVDRRR